MNFPGKTIFGRLFLLLAVISVLFACAGKSKTEKSEEKQNESVSVKKGPDFSDLTTSVFTIQTYQGDRILEKGQGFVVAENLVIAPFSLFREANRAVLTPLNGGNSITTTQYVGYDRISNQLLLYVDSLNAKPLLFYTDTLIKNVITYIAGSKTTQVQPVYKGQCLQSKLVQGQEFYRITNNVSTVQQGAPVFVSNGKVLGMATFQEIVSERNYFALPASETQTLMAKSGKPRLLSEIGNPNSKRNAAIKKIILETDFGNIEIRLFNETPVYRDNFVQLTNEGFYDNLLIHRVIRDFGIQMGAADTRNAAPDDIVGWKGPGYTLPAHIINGLYHKRGAIGSPRKPDTKNKEKRSDGSQFYIVTGRKYLDDELDDIEKDNGIKFTPAQREFYKTVGGAPHLDGQYTVFGEVISGLDVADRMSLLPTKNDFRPITDIRLKHVKIVY